MTSDVPECEVNPAEDFGRALAQQLGQSWHVERDSTRFEQLRNGHIRYSCRLVAQPSRREGEFSSCGMHLVVNSEFPRTSSLSVYGAGDGYHGLPGEALLRISDVRGSAGLIEDLILPACRGGWARQLAYEEDLRRQDAERAAWRAALRAQCPAIGEPRPDEEDASVIELPLRVAWGQASLVHSPDGTVSLRADWMVKSMVPAVVDALASVQANGHIVG